MGCWRTNFNVYIQDEATENELLHLCVFRGSQDLATLLLSRPVYDLVYWKPENFSLLFQDFK